MSGGDGLGEGEELVSLAILDGYKVRWSAETVARDVVQNFFDEVEDFEQVTVAVDGEAGTVRVEGPSVFEMEYLRYVGATTKDAPAKRTAGGFGEGFKICALVLLRDHETTLRAASGRWELRAVLRPMRHGRELCYAVRRLDEGAARAGSIVEIGNCGEAIVEAFRGAKNMFRHPKNPAFERPIYADEARGVGIWYGRFGDKGEVFYRKQLRGTMRFRNGCALTFALDDRVATLDRDRDRRDLAQLGVVARAVLRAVPDDALRTVITHLKPYWSSGHGMLTGAAHEAARRGLSMEFSPRWLARSGNEALDRYAGRLGFRVGAAIFERLGMATVAARFEDRNKVREPGPLELERIGIARTLYAHLVRHAPPCDRVMVRDSIDARPGRDYSSDPVVPASSLAAPFREGVMDCLHALSLGSYRQSSNDGDRLTAVIEGLLRSPNRIADAEAMWSEAPTVVARAQRVPVADRGIDPVEAVAKPRSVLMLVAAPDGLPPIEAFQARVTEIAAKMNVTVVVRTFDVHCEREAWSRAAPGVPTFWIGRTELARGSRTPRFAPRSYGGALVPGDDVVRAALEAAVARLPAVSRAPRGGRGRQRDPVISDMYHVRRQQKESEMEWLRRHERGEWFARRAVQNGWSDAERYVALAGGGGPEGTRVAARAIVAEVRASFVRMSPEERRQVSGWSDERFAAHFSRCAEEVRASVVALVRRFEERLAGVDEKAREALTTWCEFQLPGGPAAARARWVDHPALTRLPSFAPLCAEMLAIERERALQNHILERVFSAWHASQRAPVEEALARTRAAYERTLRAIEVATSRLDREGEDANEYEVIALLGERTKKRRDEKATKARERSLEAVRVAWEAAIAAGCTELEALTRCMALAASVSRQ